MQRLVCFASQESVQAGKLTFNTRRPNLRSGIGSAHSHFSASVRTAPVPCSVCVLYLVEFPAQKHPPAPSEWRRMLYTECAFFWADTTPHYTIPWHPSKISCSRLGEIPGLSMHALLVFLFTNEARRNYDGMLTSQVYIWVSRFWPSAHRTHLRLIGHFTLYCFTSLLTVAVPTPAMAPTSCMFFWG